ncbi:MAG: GGDEF domain-containing protein [PVC group bacterium]|nr:GGDEF domain-containing protein [PVC group bacterium]
MESKTAVLVIEKDENLRETTVAFLREKGYGASGICGNEKVVSLLKNAVFPVIVAGVCLDNSEDIEIIRQIRRISGDRSKLILMSDNRIDKFYSEEIEEMVDDYVYMPVKLNVLANVVTRNADILKLEKKVDYYRDLALHDDLTHLYNHRYFTTALEREVARTLRSGQPLALLMIDVDNFKYLNDTYGHDVGDKVLEKTADVLQMSLRGIDVLCRYGGEEFVIILPETCKEKAINAAERLAVIVENTRIYANDTDKINVTISIGVAVLPQNISSKESLMRCADQALYDAKHSGKNRVCVWNTPESKDDLQITLERFERRNNRDLTR